MTSGTESLLATWKLRLKVSDEHALEMAEVLLKIDVGWIPQALCIQVLVDDRLRLAQALRLLRDSAGEPGGYTQNVCVRALEECGIPDPPEEDHP